MERLNATAAFHPLDEIASREPTSSSRRVECRGQRGNKNPAVPRGSNG